MKHSHKVWVVVDVEGKGYSTRHGGKEIASVYELERNALAFIAGVKKEKDIDLFILPAELRYETN